MIHIVEKDLFWLAGLLEGEGTFYMTKERNRCIPVMAVSMTDEDIIKRVSELWQRKYHCLKKQKEHHKCPYRVAICGAPAIEWMTLLRPFMGKRRSAKIKSIIEEFKGQPPKIIRRKIADEQVREAYIKIANGLSLRKAARELSVHHEGLRQRLIKLNLWSRGRSGEDTTLSR